MQFRFDNRVAIVTGAGRGLGRAQALLLASRGAAVVVNDFGCSTEGEGGGDPEPARAVVAEIQSAGGSAIADWHSVADEQGIRALVETAVSKFGRLDIVVNNAGINIVRPFHEMSTEELRRLMDVHYFGPAFMARFAWPHLSVSGKGRIVNCVSGAVFGLADYGGYGAAKGAVFVLTRALAEEGKQVGIKVNAFGPYAGTRLANASLAPEIARLMDKRQPPSLVAPIIGYMAHDDCAFTGEVLTGSAGRVSRWRLGEVDGFADPELSIESIANNLDAIITEEKFHPWANAEESSAHQWALLDG